MLTAFNFNQITEYQIEVTTYCNAACPQCPRNELGGKVNPYLPLVHLPLSVIVSTFTESVVLPLKQIFFCGSYGDPIMHPEFLEILRHFRSVHPTVWLYIHTNAGVHSPPYWKEMAEIIGPWGKIDFGIDGLESTNHIYRRNVKFHKVMENCQAFIDAKGNAQWNYLVFAHNEHQVHEARALSISMGFRDFLIRKTGRFFNHNTVSVMDTWPIVDGTVLSPPKDPAYQNESIVRLPILKKQYGDMNQYWSETPITCDALLGHKVVITAEGLVLPCNFFNHNLHDKRFHEPTALPGANALSSVQGVNQIQALVDQYGSSLNIHNQSLETIFQSGFWDHVVQSWDKDLDGGRIFECALTCGKQFTKVWDQAHNNLKR